MLLTTCSVVTTACHYCFPAAPSQYDVHLFGGSNAMEGRVEIFYKGEWGTVCDDYWDLKDAIVVCRQLGYTTAVRRSINAEFGQGTGRIWRDNVGCSGAESMLSSCSASYWGSHNCYHRDDAGVVCASKLYELSHYTYIVFHLYAFVPQLGGGYKCPCLMFQI